MRADDETTAHQLRALLQSKGYPLSLRTILRCRTSLGWTFRGSSYCQLIREANKEKRLAWAQRYSGEAEGGFENVIWTDECTVQLYRNSPTVLLLQTWRAPEEQAKVRVCVCVCSVALRILILTNLLLHLQS